MSVKWLDNFNDAMSLARGVMASIDRNGELLSLTGNTIMGERLQGLAETLREALTHADDAISTMISEEAQESWNGTGKVIKTLLEATAESARS